MNNDILTSKSDSKLLEFCKNIPHLNQSLNVNIITEYRVEIDQNLFKQALLDLNHKHESLSHLYQKVEDEFLRFPNLKINESDFFTFIDLSYDPEPLQYFDIEYQEHTQREFDLMIEPGARFILFKLSEKHYRGLLVGHHLICDYISGIIFIQSISEHYDRLLNGTDLLNESNDFEAIRISNIKTEEFKNDLLIDELRQYDSPNLGRQDYQMYDMCSTVFDIPKENKNKVESFCIERNIKPFHFYLTAFQAYIQIKANSKKFIVGLPIDLRSSKKYNKAVGYLSKPYPLQVDISDTTTYLDLLKQNTKSIIKGIRNKYINYNDKTLSDNSLPKINTLFNYFESTHLNDPQHYLQFDIIQKGFPKATTDFWLSIDQKLDGFSIKGEFNKSCFDETEVKQFEIDFLDIITTIIEDTTSPILQEEKECKMIISSSFSINPLDEMTMELKEVFPFNYTFHHTPYNQVIQFLLGNNIDISSNDSVCLFLRLEDFYFYGNDESRSYSFTVNQLTESLDYSIETKGVMHTIIIAPTKESQDLKKYYNQFITAVNSKESVNLIDLRDNYDDSIFNDETNKIAHIPYQKDFYKELGKTILTDYYLQKAKPIKVIILDCDNTLWKGIFGEDGKEGIQITPHHKRFQQKIIDCYHQGILIALASKNNESDILHFIENSKEMLLKKEHLVTHRINWNEKTDSLISIAEELNLGLDSFVFIDDNNVEVEKVKLQLAGVLTFLFPLDGHQIDRFVDENVVFKLSKKKSSLVNRTQLYQEEKQRKVISSKYSLKEYIQQLNLSIEQEEINSDNASRVSELTQRTNQFNLSFHRFSEREIIDGIQNKKIRGILISAKDNYGDYGTIGLILYGIEGDTFEVINVLLSCRILGRGIEVHLIKLLKELANDHCCKHITFRVSVQDRNLPAQNFIQFLGYNVSDGKNKFTISKEDFNNIDVNEFLEIKKSSNKKKDKILVQTNRKLENRFLEYLIDNKKNKKADILPNKQLESIWLKATKSDSIDPDISFFNHGGTSLEAVFLLMEVNKLFKLNLSIGEIYTHNTFNKLSALVQQNQHQIVDHPSSLLEEIHKDIDLDLQEFPFKDNSKKLVKNYSVFVTGGSGFVGIHLVKQLLLDERYTVFCLMRKGNSVSLQSKFKTYSEEYKVPFSENELKRIQFIEGNLGVEKFGLCDNKWNHLAENITEVIHCGANVNFFEPYQNVREVNVLSNLELLKLCDTGTHKRIVYVSSMGVFHSTNNTKLDYLDESNMTGNPQDLHTGYQQTKWAAEKIYSRAIERGYDITIVRLGVVSPNTKTNAYNRSDFFVYLLSTILELGIVPDMRPIDFIDVQDVSKVITSLIHQDNFNSGEFINLVNPSTLSVNQLSNLSRFYGEKLEVVTYQKWLEVLFNFLEKNPEHELNKYSVFLKSADSNDSLIHSILYAPKVKSSNLTSILHQNDIELKEVSFEQLFQLKDTFRAVDLIKSNSTKESANENNLFGFKEKMKGDIVLDTKEHLHVKSTIILDLKGHIADIGELLVKKKVYLSGAVFIEKISPNELEIKNGFLEILPFNGYTPFHKDALVFIRYQLELETDNKTYILKGDKLNRYFSDIFYELSTIHLTLQEPNRKTWKGMASIPIQEIFKEQTKHLETRKDLNHKEKFKVSILWMGFLSYCALKNYLNLYLRNPILDGKDFKEMLKYIPPLKRNIDLYFRIVDKFKGSQILSKVIKFQGKKWLK
ncbi:HAD-IIIC family phosphatase [Flammeovirga sp. MY04]|nr:thioester reductase domain-containing protein [Flammeovirga sp. MY04]ANQ51434.2 HAD-IIIC family phosphatase [Flammeovirga sp. MY04]